MGYFFIYLFVYLLSSLYRRPYLPNTRFYTQFPTSGHTFLILFSIRYLKKLKIYAALQNFNVSFHMAQLGMSDSSIPVYS
jgi:hypothetical protein